MSLSKRCLPKTHGATVGGRPTPEHRSWSAMIQRCKNPRSSAYKHYGGRGIKVCQRWLKFENFVADVGLRPGPYHSLDRYPNNNGNYEPGNVRWATQVEQARNTRNNRLITYQGVTRCVREWEDVLGFPRNVIAVRLFHGWDEASALATPYRARSRRPRWKLHDEDIPVIINRAKTESQRAIAKDYGVYQSVISRIVSGGAWKNVIR